MTAEETYTRSIAKVVILEQKMKMKRREIFIEWHREEMRRFRKPLPLRTRLRYEASPMAISVRLAQP